MFVLCDYLVWRLFDYNFFFIWYLLLIIIYLKNKKDYLMVYCDFYVLYLGIIEIRKGGLIYVYMFLVEKLIKLCDVVKVICKVFGVLILK